MLSEMPKMGTPAWLAAIGRGVWDIRAPLPLNEMLTESLYYPACGLNGTPVKYLAGNVLSFVYTDYAVTKEEYLSNLNGVDAGCGFRGYHSIMQRELFLHDIVPSGWRPSMLPAQRKGVDRLHQQEAQCRPFGHWSVWQWSEGIDEAYGPELFSIMYFAGEMSAIYQGLYCRLTIAPKVLAIIQPGAMGGEWESITSDDSFFKEVVASNKAGMPEYLLYGGYGLGYEDPCWKEYRGDRIVKLPERQAGLWKAKP